MPRYKGNERQDIMVPVCLSEQLLPGTLEHAIDVIIDHLIDTSAFDELYHSDETGRPAYDPKAAEALHTNDPQWKARHPLPERPC